MSASAELAGCLTDPHDPHDVVVLLAEQRQHPALQRVLQTHLGRFGFVVGKHPAIHHLFDLGELRRSHRLVMREVESKTIRRNQ